MFTKNNKVFVEWKDVEVFVNHLDSKFNMSDVKGVYGVPRGGLCLATMISYKYNIPLLLAPIENCLIVDDIADSGRTLIHFKENDTQFNKYNIITMYYHNRSIVIPDYYMYNKGNDWIVFPWEMED